MSALSDPVKRFQVIQSALLAARLCYRRQELRQDRCLRRLRSWARLPERVIDEMLFEDCKCGKWEEGLNGSCRWCGD